MASPTAHKIMIVRHAEKPASDDAPYGVNAKGEQDVEALTVFGWQRAGALAVLFAPSRGPLQSAGLATPDCLFAAAVAKHAKSERPIDTITPLAHKLGLAICDTYTKGQEKELAEAAVASKGSVLIAWQHEDIPAIADAIPLGKDTVPQKWPDDRFDLVWVFDLDAASGKYRFNQVPQLLLKGDRNSVIE
ncbi:hypothetical protein [Burkholderia oklahomensis]|uniref:hypothetical protein n=1 Tax=Burkholderia oklahomensis TaxID=342113 RepID=UPI00016A8AC0|nr:hypothetical protein [Burkholderia oklahomensis]AJX31047.1 hypothetical protein BG90_205 [Burkholderia oklahomensis C6786]AOI47770.1 hypothetical protein WI23_11805 [Burkholderia oklahomensis C6786]KUY56297.1 hypothetical protein WI23_20105 [Burkholderia oklahomensis C6786]MBI0360984.1 hypothetical protein [Burkholderia oklahomensis]SUW60361.1 Uncharacterised protein [Burkholderia oklahomensis]